MFSVLLAIGKNAENSLRAAEAIADIPDVENSVHVTVLHVAEEFNIAYGDGSTLSPENLRDEDEIEESVKNVVQFLEEQGISVSVKLSEGDVTNGIIEAADEINANRIVMAGRKRSPIGKAIFDSTTQSVLLNSNRPVTVITLDG